MNFIEQITEAYQERLEEKRQADAARHKVAIAAVARRMARLGVEDYETTDDPHIIIIEGLTIKPDLMQDEGYVVLGSCPDCGQKYWSKTVYDLAGIGEMFHDMTPDAPHSC